MLKRIISELRQIANSTNAEYLEYPIVYPIGIMDAPAIKIGHGSNRLYSFCGVHGDEVSPLIALAKTAEMILQAKLDVTFYGIAINPLGTRDGVRETVLEEYGSSSFQDFDFNWIWKNDQFQELRDSVISIFDGQAEFTLCDHHEGKLNFFSIGTSPYLLIPSNFDERDVYLSRDLRIGRFNQLPCYTASEQNMISYVKSVFPTSRCLIFETSNVLYRRPNLHTDMDISLARIVSNGQL
ncbi:MAG: hypothetical protein NDI94_01160 [Candidatus Woesearchaeota archaeon]|nr:hypothetical protein [Candidatus Woesearchaeota archaeon]